MQRFMICIVFLNRVLPPLYNAHLRSDILSLKKVYCTECIYRSLLEQKIKSKL